MALAIVMADENSEMDPGCRSMVVVSAISWYVIYSATVLADYDAFKDSF